MLCVFFFFKNFKNFCLNSGVNEKDLLSAVSLPKRLAQQRLDGYKIRTQNSLAVSHIGDRSQNTCASTHCLPRALAGSWVRIGKPRGQCCGIAW